MGVRITFLGTASGTPSRTRNVTAQALTLDSGALWLLDAGEATQHQFMRAGLRASRIERILITHLHGDHSYGLPGILSCMTIHNRTEPVDIIGPKGVEEFVRSIVRLSDATLSFPIKFYEVEGGQPIDLPACSGWRVRALPITHRIPCFGYLLTEDARPGRLHPDRLRTAGVPEGPLWGRLQHGETVVLADGRQVKASAVCDPERPGRRVVLLGDTCDARIVISEALGCDLLVCESTYDAQRMDKAIQWGHSTSVMTGRLAAEAQAKNLIITHFSARYTDDDHEGHLSVADLLRETSACCPGTKVFAADDLWSFTVPFAEHV